MKKQNSDPKDNNVDSVEKAGEQKVESDTPTTVEKQTAKRGTKTPTSKKRELKAMPGNYSMFKVAYVGGGETPRELRGLYSTVREADKAIKLYLSKKK